MSVKGVFACVGRCVGTDMYPCVCVCTHVCEGFDHLCPTVCPHDCVWVQCVCAYLRAGCVYGVCMCVYGVWAQTCLCMLVVASYRHGLCLQCGTACMYVKDVCADVSLRRYVCEATGIGGQVCVHMGLSGRNAKVMP